MLTPVMIALLSVHYQYSPLGQVIALSNTVAGQSQSHFVAQYDKEGKQTTSNHFTYRYDGLGRLQTVTGDGQTIRYRFDLASNMKDWPIQTNPPALSYNSAGNLRHTPQGGVLDYNVLNQLTQYQANGVRTDYLYNGNDLRLAKIGPQQNQLFFYGPNARLWNIDKNGEMQAYLFGQHRLANLSGKLYFYLYDLHGDVVQLVTPQGKVLSTYAYGPYGRNTTNTKEGNNPFRYVGGYFDGESGLQYQQARYRLPGAGFITRDYAEQWNGASFPFDATNILTMNEYAFAGGDPVGNVDVDGHNYQVDEFKMLKPKMIYATSQDSQEMMSVPMNVEPEHLSQMKFLSSIFNPNNLRRNCVLVVCAACLTFKRGVYYQPSPHYDKHLNIEAIINFFKLPNSVDASISPISIRLANTANAVGLYFSKTFKWQDSFGILGFVTRRSNHVVNYIYKNKRVYLYDFQTNKYGSLEELLSDNFFATGSKPEEFFVLPVGTLSEAKAPLSYLQY